MYSKITFSHVYLELFSIKIKKNINNSDNTNKKPARQPTSEQNKVEPFITKFSYTPWAMANMEIIGKIKNGKNVDF